MPYFKSRILVFISLVAVILGLGACGRQSARQTSTSKPIHVVASLDFYGEVARAVLGDHGQVNTIIKSSSVDPHDYEPTPQVAATVSQANVVLANGLGYDAWLQKLVKSNGKDGVQNIRVGEDVMHQKMGANEHIWYNPDTMTTLANSLAKRFGKLAPKYRQAYQRNAKAYITSLAPLQKQIASLKKHRGSQPVAASEPVFDYALDALGYQRTAKDFELAVENGTDPAPKTIRDLQSAIKTRRLAFFVNNPQASSKTVTSMVTLAKSADVPVLNVTETLPKGKTYLSWMQDQYQDLAKIQDRLA